ncbi:hypothetical protein ACFLSQ_09360, partial [Bacteroidota bacterium]
MKLLAASLLILISFTCFHLTAQENNYEKLLSNLKNQNPKIQSLDTLPPEPYWVLCLCGVNIHTKRYVYDRPDIPSIRSNLMSITLDEELSYNFTLSYGNFMPCDDYFTDWKLEFIEKNEDALGVVTFSDCVGNDTTLYIQYNQAKFAVVPEEWDFGLHSTGDTSEKMFYVVNESETFSCGLGYLMLKNKDENTSPQGFTVWDSSGTYQLPTQFNPPIEIAPLDSMPFIVKFEATEAGEFWDSIGLGDTNNFWYYAGVEAEVGIPIIEVSDWNFPPTRVGGGAWGEFDVQNIGSVNLEIYGYQGPFITGLVSGTKIYSSMELEDRWISPDNPMILKPYETATFGVRYTPDEEINYPDSIVFISNTAKYPVFNKGNPIDSVCVFTGSGIRSNLEANGYNWERKRIHRPGTFPVAPYPAVTNAMNPDTAIRLYNDATAPIQIVRLINEVETGDISAFQFNRGDLLRTIDSNESVIIPVTFQPTQAGLHLLTIRYETNPPKANITTTLQGTGIVPRIETQDVDFGATIVNDFDNYVTKAVTFRNLSDIEWQYGDSVTISDFVENNTHTEITNSWDMFPEPFRYDKDLMFSSSPIVLQPGKSFTFDADFVAKGAGIVKGYLTTQSDAELDVTSTWTGYDTETGIADYSYDNLLIFPNPADDKVIISAIKESDILLKIIDILGNEIYSEKLLITNDQLQ